MQHARGDSRVMRALYRHLLLSARRVERTVSKERTRLALRHIVSSHPALSQAFKSLEQESNCLVPSPTSVVRHCFRTASSGALEARIDDGFEVMRKLRPLMERLNLHAQLNNFVLSSDGIEEGALLLSEQDRRLVDRQVQPQARLANDGPALASFRTHRVTPQAFRRQIDEIADRICVLQSQV
jgi:hypothetical protein